MTHDDVKKANALMERELFFEEFLNLLRTSKDIKIVISFRDKIHEGSELSNPEYRTIFINKNSLASHVYANDDASVLQEIDDCAEKSLLEGLQNGIDRIRAEAKIALESM